MQKRSIGLAALACAGLLAAGSLAVAAQAAPEQGDVLRAAVPGPPGGAAGFHERLDPAEMAERRDEFHADLAEELGVTAEEVERAFEAVFEKRLDEAVADGRLTREQAERILEAKDAGMPPGPVVRMHIRGEGPGEGAPPPPPPLP